MENLKTNSNNPYVSLVIPAYNEEKRIQGNLKKVKEFLDTKSYTAELIIVDDGSKDQTVAIARDCLNGFHNHAILSYPINKGKGHAVKQGVLKAKGNYVVFLDADLSTPIEELDVFLQTLEKDYNVVIGTRKNKDAKVKKRQPFFRELLGKGFTLLSNMLIVNGISDLTCGFKGFKREVGQDIFRRQLINNWSFDTEILFLAQKLGYKIKELPVTWYDAEGTKVRLYRDIIGSLKGIVQIRLNYFFKVYKLDKRDDYDTQ